MAFCILMSSANCAKVVISCSGVIVAMARSKVKIGISDPAPATMRNYFPVTGKLNGYARSEVLGIHVAPTTPAV